MYVYACIHAYIYEYYSVKNKKEILPLMTIWMDLQGIMLRDVRDRERQMLHDLTYVWNLKMSESQKQRVN